MWLLSTKVIFIFFFKKKERKKGKKKKWYSNELNELPITSNIKASNLRQNSAIVQIKRKVVFHSCLSLQEAVEKGEEKKGKSKTENIYF